MRNNIELTHIADNKANVLLSLNALMLTFLIPFVIPYLETIKLYNLGIPIMILVITCFITIYIAVLVLKPGPFDHNKERLEKGSYVSPFFFGNFYKMERKEFSAYIKNAVAGEDLIKKHLVEDLHYIGTRLGRKMTLIRYAFNIFMIGLFVTIILAIIFLFTFSQSPM